MSASRSPHPMSRRSKGGIGQRSVRPDVSLTREQLSELMDVDPPNPIPRPQRRRQVLAPAEPALYFSLDYGTKTLPVACKVHNPGVEATIHDLRIIKFHGRNRSAPQDIGIGAFHADTQEREFYWGGQVEDALNSGKVKPENVIRLWKLLLYKRFQNSRLVLRLKAQLKRLKIELVDLIAAHLENVIAQAKEIIKNSALMGGAFVDAVNNLPTKVFLSVPQMWKAPANRVMLEAAKRAHIEFVELVHEPECAAAFYTHGIARDPHSDHVPGYEMIVCDVGGGTGDFVVMRFLGRSTDGAKVKLESVGEATGALCGSELVNEEFRIWLQDNVHTIDGQRMNFAELCEYLGRSEAAVFAQASDMFEQQKISFNGQQRQPFAIPLSGDVKVDRQLEQRLCTIWYKTVNMVEFFRPVFEKIFEQIDRHLTEDTKAIIIPGGFGSSRYLQKQLEAKYPDLKIQSFAPDINGSNEPVALGAPLRYDEIKVRSLNPDESFGVSQVEEYDPNTHRDAANIPSRRAPAQFHQGQVVYERWAPILKRGDLNRPDDKYGKGKWQLMTIPVSEFRTEYKSLDVQVYWTEDDLAEHTPMRTGDDGHSPLIDAIEEWGPPIRVWLPDLQDAGFDKKRSEGTQQGDVYQFYYRVALTGEGANMSATVEIADVGTQPYDAGGASTNNQAIVVIKKETMMVCDERYNPNVRTGI